MYKLDQVGYVGGKTNTAGALQLMNEHIFDSKNGDRVLVPNYAIVLTDGVPNVDDALTIKVPD